MAVKFLSKPTPHGEAMDFLAGMPVVDRATFDAMLPEFRHAAFLMTGIWQHDVLQDIRDTVAEGHAGEDWAAVRERIAAALEPHLGAQAWRRSLMILRNAIYKTSAASVTRQLDNHMAAFPFRKRLSAGDGRVRDAHRAMHGMILPADSPFWEAHTPPDAHNCRCQVTGVTRLQAEKIKAQEDADVAAGTMLPEERRIPDAAVQKQQEGGIINRGLSQQWNLAQEPGTVEWSPRSLYIPMSVIKARYTPAEFAAFEKFARGVKPDGVTTLWEAITKQRGTYVPPVVKPIQPALPWRNGAGVKPRTRAEVLAAISPDMPGSGSIQLGGGAGSTKPQAPGTKPPAAAPAVPAAGAGAAQAPAASKVKALKPASAAAGDQVRARVDVRARDAGIKKQAAEALGLIAQVHSDGGLKLTRLVAGTQAGQLGSYSQSSTRARLQADRLDIDTELRLRAGDAHPLNTALHELGHKIDLEMIGNDIIAPRHVINAKADQVRADLLAELGKTATLKDIGASARFASVERLYLLNEKEIFARAYAQYIATRTGDAAALAELASLAGGGQKFMQWPAAEFAPVLPLFDRLFVELGWMK